MITFLVSTRNTHKVAEIRAILGNKFRYLTLAGFPAAPTVVEDAGTFAGNATKKAVELARWLAGAADFESPAPDFVLADDSGLAVDALEGAPGVYSARFAALDSGRAGNSSSADNNAKLLRLLEGVPPTRRTARFQCALALTPVARAGVEVASPVCYADESEIQTRVFEGACEGRIALAPCGAGGFGYDPLFVPEGFEQSFAELEQEFKNRISHRAQALEKLKAEICA